MAKNTPTPWRVFKTTSGLKLVGVGGQDGQGILDAGYGVWAWDDPEGIANAEMVVTAVNNHEALVEALHGLIIGATCEVNEKGAGGFMLARLSDAKKVLGEVAPDRLTALVGSVGGSHD